MSVSVDDGGSRGRKSAISRKGVGGQSRSKEYIKVGLQSEKISRNEKGGR